MSGDHETRKADHLDLCATDDVAFREKTTLFEQVHLIHDALPDLRVADIDLSTRIAGRTLRAPLVIAAMTGGVERAEAVNRDLAAVAEARGLAFGFGSMRPLLEHDARQGYRVRDVAPTIPLLGNVGVVQARKASTQQVEDLVGICGLTALVVHLNPAMEVVQPGGDDDFRGGLETIARLVEGLSVPVIVKETGCGLSRDVGRRLASVGVRTVDVSGAGGTSWVGVETLRAKATRSLGEAFWDWGIPTAASVVQLSGLGLEIVATGGLKGGRDLACALALGASAGGMARALLMAWNQGGMPAVHAAIDPVLEEVRTALLLTGSGSIAALHQKPIVVGPALAPWVPRNTPLSARIGA